MATFQDVILKIPGLTHYYPLANDAKDIVGSQHGTIKGTVKFDGTHAKFDGASGINLGDSNDFSSASTASKALTIVVFQIVDDWTKRSHNNEYVHWAGKGGSGSYETTFRYYVDGGGGEAPARKRRTSFYSFNPSGGLGAGSFFQDAGDGNGTERVITAMVWGDAGNGGKTQMWKNGQLRDTDELSGYNIYPKNTGAPFWLGTRGDNTGFLVGRLRRVAFFNRKLTEAEIKSIYDARNLAEGGGGSTAPSAPPVAQEPTPATPSDLGFGSGGVSINGAIYPVTGIDAARQADALIVYTKGDRTGTNEYGFEAAVANGKITAVKDGVGNMVIPRGGVVLSGHGRAREWLRSNAKVGATVTLPSGL